MAPGPDGSTVGTERPIVLFVDDERDILHDIRWQLRDDRDLYDLHFAESGADALDVLRWKTSPSW